MKGCGYRVALLLLYDERRRILLQHRTRDARLLPGHWAFFGGGFRKGEELRQALAREIFEEIRYIVREPVLVHEQDFRENGTVGHLYVFVEALAAAKEDLELREGQGWGWFLQKETGRLKMAGRDRKIFRIASSHIRRVSASRARRKKK